MNVFLAFSLNDGEFSGECLDINKNLGKFEFTISNHSGNNICLFLKRVTERVCQRVHSNEAIGELEF